MRVVVADLAVLRGGRAACRRCRQLRVRVVRWLCDDSVGLIAVEDEGKQPRKERGRTQHNSLTNEGG